MLTITDNHIKTLKNQLKENNIHMIDFYKELKRTILYLIDLSNDDTLYRLYHTDKKELYNYICRMELSYLSNLNNRYILKLASLFTFIDLRDIEYMELI